MKGKTVIVAAVLLSGWTWIDKQTAWAELDAVREVYGERDFLIQYQCSKDFTSCVRAIPELAIHSEGAYAQEYRLCCVNLSHGLTYAETEVPAECDQNFTNCRPSRKLSLATMRDDLCGDDMPTEAEARRQNLLEAVANRDGEETQ